MADSNNNQSQRRTLWIMAAAGIFLLVVIGAAVILYSPAVQKQAAEEAGVATSDSFDPNDGWSEVGLEAVGVTSPDEVLSDGSLIADASLSPFESNGTANSDDAYSFNLDELKTFDSSAIAKPSDTLLADSVFASDAAASKSNTESIDLNKIASSSNVSAKNDFTAAQIESAKDASKSVSNVYSDVKTTTNKTSTAVKTATTSKTTSSVPSIWIQVGSFEDVTKANNSRTLLEENGYKNVSVLTRSADSKTMYRVRVGPYSSKSTAEAAAAKISKIKQFSECYVVDSNAPAVITPILK